jgi:uncharacterized protein YcfJ
MKPVLRAVVTPVLIAVAAGCANAPNAPERSNTEKGAIGGALLGGIIGAAAGGDSKSALKGALAGAAIGAIVGHYQDKQVASREEAARRYAVRDNTPRLEVESAANAPSRVERGGTVESQVGYTVLGPAPGQDVKLTEVRTLMRDQDSFELSRREVVRTQGTHASVFRFTLPKDLEAGDYTLVTTVSQGSLVKTVRAPLTVA